ncbi:hypothetical protein OU798_02705 [Prolixibacteraceae bacterium Z1-6]|uniref:Uncharacterized protein n=1 Tax=Draconibacterium aestuarii TaxID=2998507 RepID=A0A9X3F5B7_9BACT|nr:hypothetical protein [Prolixibacteraceae bacterium Z1-6]
MKTLEEDYKSWLIQKGYDYEIYADTLSLWIDFWEAQSDEALDSVNTVNRFETKEEIDEAIRQQDRDIASLRSEYMMWKMENIQKYNSGAGEVELFYHFLQYRDANNNQ